MSYCIATATHYNAENVNIKGNQLS